MRKSRFTVAVVFAFVLAVVVLPESSVASPLRQDSVSYVVRRGDNLSSIASRYGSTVSAIVQANGLTGALIRPGQTLVIPTTSAQVAPLEGSRNSFVGATTSGSHVVRSGESLWSIASLYGVSVGALKALNGLSGDIILPGQTLSIPAASSGGSGSGVNFGVPSQPASRASSCNSGYVVKPGDTLSSIASRCGVSVRLLREVNGISGSAIYRGQTLRIPSSNSTTPWPSASQSAAVPPYAPPIPQTGAAPSQTAGEQPIEVPFPTPVPPFPPLSYPLPGQ